MISEPQHSCLLHCQSHSHSAGSTLRVACPKRGHLITAVRHPGQRVTIGTQEGAVAAPSIVSATRSVAAEPGCANMSDGRTCLMVMLGFHPASSLMMDRQILPLGYTLRAARPSVQLARL